MLKMPSFDMNTRPETLCHSYIVSSMTLYPKPR